MIKKYNIDELWYDKEAKKMVLSGWILIDKFNKTNLYIYKDDEIYEEMTLENVRKDVINAHKASISKDKSIVAFFCETEINLSMPASPIAITQGSFKDSKSCSHITSSSYSSTCHG